MACISPYYAYVSDRWIPTPCGRCPPCKKRRVDSWVFRLLQEDKVSWSAHFVTLTYDPDHVPISPNGFMTLTKGKHKEGKRWIDDCCFTKYMKRLRKLVKSECPGEYRPIKYYACGEYGSQNKRPHWHAIIFNVPDEDMFFRAWSHKGVNFGDVHVGDVSGDSVAYCMKYIDKRSDPFHARDDRVREFSLMSKSLGASYLTSDVLSYHKSDISRLFITLPGGFRIAMPRYYKDRIFDADERAAQGSIVDLAVGKSNSDNYGL